MNRRPIFRPRDAVLLALVLAGQLGSATVAWADDRPLDARWIALQEQSRAALATLNAPLRHGRAAGPDLPASARLVVVGFTGGREGPDSRVSGVVRLRRQIQQSITDRDHVVVMTYNNRDWSRAAADVAARMPAVTPIGLAGHADATQRPLVVVFGHSWGGGAITKFARLLGERDIDVALAVYVDAFSLRNPRVPGNVRYAVNLYQRSGIFRGLPLRGKSKLVLEDPSATMLLANLQIKPQTDRYFGWHWNLVQPLLYLHHHRMGHDVRLHHYLLTLIEAVDREDDLRPPASITCELDDQDACAGDLEVMHTAAATGP